MEDGTIPGSRDSIYKNVFDNASQPIVIVAEDGRILTANAAFQSFFGAHLHLETTRLQDFFLTDEPLPPLKDLCGAGALKVSFTAPDGHQGSGLLRLAAADDGQIICFVEDMSSRQGQRAFLQLLINLSIRENMVLPDMLVEAFGSFCRNFDCKAVSLLQMVEGEEGVFAPFSHFPPAAGERILGRINERGVAVTRGGDIPVLGEVPLEHYRKGKSLYFPIHLAGALWGYLVVEGRSVSALSRTLAQPTFLKSILMWLTGRVSEHVARANLIELNRQVQLREESLRTLYRSSPIMLHLADDENRILEVSDKWLEVMGYDRDEVIGKRAYDFLSPASYQYNMAKVRPDFLTYNRVQNVPLTMLRKDNSPIDIEASAVRTRVADGSMQSFSVLVDVTERNRALKEIEEKRESLKKANNSLRKFTYIASHDFQEPLRKMQQFSYLLRQDCEDELSPEGQEYLQIIAASAQRMSALIGDLLLYSRISNSLPELTEVDMNELVASALEVERRHTGTELAIDLQLDLLPVIYADKLQTQRLVRALFSNAIKFRHPQRSLRISVSFTHAPGADAYVLRFSDNGIGFENRYEDKIFEPLQKLHPGQLYGGTGMGLAIVRAICDNHHWRINAEGTLNQGSTFQLVLPPGTLAGEPR